MALAAHRHNVANGQLVANVAVMPVMPIASRGVAHYTELADREREYRAREHLADAP